MPFEKGQSGNPHGRAIDKPWRDAVRIAVKRTRNETLAVLDDPAAPMLARIAAHCVLKAGGDEADVVAIKEIGDRLDGKPKQQTEVTGGEDADGNTIPVGIDVRFLGGTAGQPDNG